MTDIFDIADTRRKYFLKFFSLSKNYNGSVWEFGLLNCMIGISKHILLDNNDIFKEFKNSVTEQLQNGFVDWWRRENYSDRSQGRRKFQSQEFEDVQRKIWSGCLCQNVYGKFNELVNLPLYCITNWIWCYIKNFLKISQMAGSKKFDLRRRSQAEILYTQ